MRREVACPSCGASWRAPPARYCGRCGGGLAEVADPAPRPRRYRAGVVHLVLPLVAVAATLVAVDRAPLRATEEEAAVEVSPPAGAAVLGDGPSRAELADTLAQFDRPRLRCEPDGCERWRRTLERSWAPVVAAGDGVLMLEQGMLVRLDGATGEETWRRPVTGVVRGAGTAEAVPWTPDVSQLILVAAGGDVLLADHAGVAQLLDEDGRARWTALLPVRDMGWPMVVDDVVLVVGRGDRLSHGGRTVLAAVDRRDGAVVWQRTLGRGEGPHEVTNNSVVLLTAHRFEVLDPATGELLSVHPATGESWLETVGPWHVVRPGADDGLTRLVDPRSGAVVAELPGVAGYRVLDLGERIVLALWPDGAHGGPTSVVALDRQGTIRWEHALTARAPYVCCEMLGRLDEDTLVVRTHGEEPFVALDATTGRPRPDVVVADVPPEAWWEGSLVHIQEGGATKRLQDGAGRYVRLSSEAWPILEDPLVVVSEREVVGMRLTEP